MPIILVSPHVHRTQKVKSPHVSALHNSDARQSDSNEWPLPLIFNVAYGCAALKMWGVPDFINFARERANDNYYDPDDNGDKEKARRRRVLVSKRHCRLSDLRPLTLPTWSWRYGCKKEVQISAYPAGRRVLRRALLLTSRCPKHLFIVI
jgi:hypothetical protein